MKIEHKYILAADLLFDIWMHINWELVDQKRSRNIWNEFEGQVRALSKCNSKLSVFISMLCKRMNSYVSADIIKTIEELDEKKTLDIYRFETQIPILILRLRRQETKEI